jgi:hypothetical protein
MGARLAADGMLVWVEGDSPEHHNFSHEILGRATESASRHR